MSIGDCQRRATARELQSLRKSLPYDGTTLEVALGYAPGGLPTMLEVPASDPRAVWHLRDFLVAAAKASGVEVPEFSVLQDARRKDAKRWFGRWDVPEPPA